MSAESELRAVLLAHAPLLAVDVSAANPLPVALPPTAATSAAQIAGNESLASIDADIGAQADAAASSDTGTFSLIALVKRLLTKLPPLVSGRAPVTFDGVAQPVSGTVTATGPLTNAELRAAAVPVSATSLPLPAGAATSAAQTTTNTALASIAGLSVPAHDHVTLGYTGSDVTSVVYRTGGSGGTVVATLTLAYSGGNLTTVTRA